MARKKGPPKWLAAPRRSRHHQHPCPAAPAALRGRKAAAKARGGSCRTRTCAADRPIAKALCRGRSAFGIAAYRAAAKAAGGHGLAIAALRDRPIAKFAGREALAVRATGDPPTAEARGRVAFAVRGSGPRKLPKTRSKKKSASAKLLSPPAPHRRAIRPIVQSRGDNPPLIRRCGISG